MKYQAISIEFYRNMKEIEQDKKDLKLMLNGLKYGYFLAILIIILSAFFNGNLVMAQSQNIEFEFDNAYAYNGVLPESTVLENQRYTTEPTGHFPATYSFENDTVGTFPQEWNDASGVDCTTLIINDLDGHNKVLNITDNSNSARYYVYNLFDSVIQGTTEFWFRTTDKTKTLDVRFYDKSPTLAITIQLDALVGLENDEWSHYKIFWDTDTDLYSHWFNGILIASDVAFSLVSDGFGTLGFIGNNAENGYSCFIDAVGYSWDIIQDNYTLYDFTDDTIGQEPEGWDIFKQGTCTATVIESYEGKSNVLRLLDNRNDGRVEANRSFTSIANRFIEMDVAISNPSDDGGYIQYTENENVITLIGFFDYDLYYYSSGWQMFKENIIVADTFISIKLQLNDADNEFDIFLDGNLEASGLAYHTNTIVSIDDICFQTDTLYLYSMYFDNIFLSNTSIALYNIGDNLYSTYGLTNNTETDKFEFTFDSTGNVNVNGDDDVSGFTDIENDYWNDDAVNVYDSIDDDIDKCIRLYGGQLGSIGIQRSFDVGVDNIEVHWQFDLIEFSYPENEIFIKITNSGSETIALFKLNGSYIMYGPRRYADLCYYYDSEWIILQSGIQTYNNYNMTFVLNWTDGNDFGVLSFDGFEYEILFENDQNSFGYLQIYGINDNTVVYGYLDLQIDWIRLIVNGSSLSDELMPDNMYILNGNDFSLLYQSFVEITFNITYDNNVSIFLNDDVEIIPYIYNASAQRVFFANFYQAKSYSGLFLKIYNSTSYKIENIKIYGIQMINQQDSNDNSFLEFDYSHINPNESYFYVSGNDLHYYFESDDNGNLEYIQATFNIVDLSCEGYSIAFSHQKGTTYLQSECKVVFTTDTYLSFLSMDTLQSVSVILPQEKIIKEIIFLVTDDDDTIIDTSEGYFSDFLFMYYSDIGITITTLSLLDMIPIVVLVVIIPMALYVGFGKRKEILVPSIMGMTIFGTVIGIIPIWLTAVILFSCICYYLIRKFGSG